MRYLFLQCHAHAVELAAQRRSQLGDGADDMANLRKSRPDRIQDIHRHPLDGALRDAHLLADHLVDGQIVDRLFDTILRRDVAQLSRNGQIDRETVADLDRKSVV